MKDHHQKFTVLEYYLRRKWYPQLEVNVQTKHRISNAPKLITDIDVLGVFPDANGKLRMILGDCKTLKGQSPITRVFWLSGLMNYFNGMFGLIVLSKKIEKEHQITSSKLDIKLLSESDFNIYTKKTANYIDKCDAKLLAEEKWSKFSQIPKQTNALSEIHGFVASGFWNLHEANLKLRTGIAIFRKNRRELNPSNTVHLALLLDLFSLVAIAINQILIEVFDSYLLPESKTELEQDLKPIIWGSIDNYNHLNELRKRFKDNSSNSDNNLALPEWDMFLELIRLLLENPLKFHEVPLFLKELAFHYYSPKFEGYSNYLSGIVTSNPNVIPQANKLCQYLVKAGGIPTEFYEKYAFDIIEVGAEGSGSSGGGL